MDYIWISNWLCHSHTPNTKQLSNSTACPSGACSGAVSCHVQWKGQVNGAMVWLVPIISDPYFHGWSPTSFSWSSYSSLVNILFFMWNPHYPSQNLWTWQFFLSCSFPKIGIFHHIPRSSSISRWDVHIFHRVFTSRMWTYFLEIPT